MKNTLKRKYSRDFQKGFEEGRQDVLLGLKIFGFIGLILGLMLFGVIIECLPLIIIPLLILIITYLCL